MPQFGASFFVVTGFHGLHVLTGVVALTAIAIRALRNRYSASGIEVAGLYWHFIDVVWIFFYTALYLIGKPII